MKRIYLLLLIFSFLSVSFKDARPKVIFDTDIDSDVDDVGALHGRTISFRQGSKFLSSGSYVNIFELGENIWVKDKPGSHSYIRLKDPGYAAALSEEIDSMMMGK